MTKKPGHEPTNPKIDTSDKTGLSKKSPFTAEQLLRTECISDSNASGDLLRVVMQSPSYFYIDYTPKGEIGSEKGEVVFKQRFAPEIPLVARAALFVSTFNTLRTLTTNELFASIQHNKGETIEEAPAAEMARTKKNVHHMIDQA